MKLALPIWDERISPVFDVAKRLRVVEVEDGGVVDRIDHRIGAGSHVSLLSELEIEVLICSAISRALETAARNAGVTVIPDICGDVDEVTQAYLLDQLGDPRFACPRQSCEVNRSGSIGNGSKGSQQRRTRQSPRTHPGNA
jgi:predicted Fe-Mo cluster-binding NifX family protein